MTDIHPLASLIRRWERRTPLSAEDRSAILSLPAISRVFGRGEYLVRDGERTRNCMLLLDGLAFRQKVVRDGKRQIISIHIPGEFVDLQNNLLSDADHSVQSLSKVEAAVIPAVALNDLAASHPAVGRAMWMDTLIDSSIFREWVVNVGRRDATTRIAHLLCELIVRLRASGVGEGDSYRFPLTQEHLADCTGLTAVHTNRVLQKLRGLGMLSLTAKSLTVLDWPALKDTGEFNDRYLHHAA